MNAPVTEAHLRLANQLVSSPPSPLVLATLIADSEARVTAQLRAECNNLRADLDAIKAIRDEETARAERAEALHLDTIDEAGAQAKVMNEYRLRAERAEAELAAERAKTADCGLTIASLCDGILGEDFADRSDQTLIRIGCGMKKELAASRYETVKAAQEGLRECIRAERAEEIAGRYGKRAISLEAELAIEREKVKTLRSALQNLVDEQNGAPLERRREKWEEAMNETRAALAATEDTK